MRRMLALGVAVLALVAAGFLWTRDAPVATASEAPRFAADATAADDQPLEAPASAVTDADHPLAPQHGIEITALMPPNTFVVTPTS